MAGKVIWRKVSSVSSGESLTLKSSQHLTIDISAPTTYCATMSAQRVLSLMTESGLADPRKVDRRRMLFGHIAYFRAVA